MKTSLKKAFGLWQAIMIILIISGLMIVILKYSRIAAEHTSDTYVKEQTELYLNSAIEMTLLAISDQNRSIDCLTSFTPPGISVRSIDYNASVAITKYYLLSNDSQGDNINCTNAGATVINIQSEETHGMVMLEVTATASVDGNVTTRILRRTLQRP